MVILLLLSLLLFVFRLETKRNTPQSKQAPTVQHLFVVVYIFVYVDVVDVVYVCVVADVVVVVVVVIVVVIDDVAVIVIYTLQSKKVQIVQTTMR